MKTVPFSRDYMRIVHPWRSFAYSRNLTSLIRQIFSRIFSPLKNMILCSKKKKLCRCENLVNMDKWLSNTAISLYFILKIKSTERSQFSNRCKKQWYILPITFEILAGPAKYFLNVAMRVLHSDRRDFVCCFYSELNLKTHMYSLFRKWKHFGLIILTQMNFVTGVPSSRDLARADNN